MSTAETSRLREFDVELEAANLRGQWIYDEMLESVVGGPKPAGVPFLWRWQDVHAKLQKSCDVMPESFTARRNLSFINPATRGTTHTMNMGMQMLKPGEIAYAHRHTMAALRFAIQGGPGLITVVDGEPCQMDNYDLVLTPRWTWHDHENATAENAVWLDVLDIGLVLGLNVPFYEPYGEKRQPQREHPGEHLADRAGLLRPAWEQVKTANFPFRYPWRDVERQLERMAGVAGSPYDGVVLRYANPVTGGSTMPTLDCWVQLLRPGQRTDAHRHTSSAVYFVVRGEGTAVVDEVELDWGPHDSFVVPNWSTHHFVNRSAHDAVLFSVNDIPTLKALDLYFEEPELSLGAYPFPPVPANLRHR
ncbi:Gentisate 1,2-dioxygenase [uncultured Mycobacterium sp.]|uniref:Cupin n=2 Tax=Mycobacteriaceae TaxID=1762 RepID=A0A064C9L1_9MYCO|nr:cupin domain-containing protein [Mycolicibacterium aromaticivorans]KDE97294.1 cupin [Mycolicibacterium aromaticivorans JS19b1 = JCM 16368]SBS78821.1 Gentisate 1,2-dioxygenase [uncultured Mycobacterium sp.]